MRGRKIENVKVKEVALSVNIDNNLVSTSSVGNSFLRNFLFNNKQLLLLLSCIKMGIFK